jgi:hypothetical protein
MYATNMNKEYPGLKKDRYTSSTIFISNIFNFKRNNKEYIGEIDISKIRELVKDTSSTIPSLADIQGRKPKVREHKGAVLPLESLPEKYRLPLRPTAYDNHENNLTRVPSKHPWESKTSVYTIDDAFYGIVPIVKGLYADDNGNPITGEGYDETDKEQLPPFINFPLPIGTPYAIRMFNLEDSKTVSFFAYSNVELDDAYTKRVQSNMHTFYWYNYVPRLGKSINKHSRPVGDVLLVPTENLLVTLFAEDPVHVPALCECGGVYRSSNEGFYFCEKCGLQHMFAFATYTNDEDDSDDSVYDEIDKKDTEEKQEKDGSYGYIHNLASTGMASKYQAEEVLGTTVTDSGLKSKMQRIAEWEAAHADSLRQIRNKDAFLDDIEDAPIDEIRARNKVKGRAAASERAKRALLQQQRTDRVYKSRQSEYLRRNRMAMILAWAKMSGTISATKLLKLVIEHGTFMHKPAFFILLDQLAQSGRIALVDGEQTNKGQKHPPKVVTYLQ